MLQWNVKAHNDQTQSNDYTFYLMVTILHAAFPTRKIVYVETGWVKGGLYPPPDVWPFT